jgi:hypothetical protein
MKHLILPDTKMSQDFNLPYIHIPTPTTNTNIINPAIIGAITFIRKTIIATIIIRTMMPTIIVAAADAIPKWYFLLRSSEY